MKSSSNIHTISYTHIVSSALLIILDHELYYNNNDGTITVNLEDKDVKQLLEFHIESSINAEYQFGNHNIVINSCYPKDNWRKQFTTVIESSKYRIIEDQINIDLNVLDVMVDVIWRKISTKMKRFVWVYCTNVDMIDILTSIKNITNSNINYPHNTYIMLTDENNNYIHCEDVDSRVMTEVEIILRKNEVIL